MQFLRIHLRFGSFHLTMVNRIGFVHIAQELFHQRQLRLRVFELLRRQSNVRRAVLRVHRADRRGMYEIYYHYAIWNISEPLLKS